MSWRASRPYVPPPGESEPAVPPAKEASWTPVPYVPSGGQEADDLAGRVRAALTTYADFPREGILFRDISPVLRDPDLLDDVVARMAEEAARRRVDSIAAIESRGFLLGAPLAVRMDLPLVPIRKQGKLPGDTVSRRYDLEYGTAELEMQIEAVAAGSAVLLVDDLLATGGTLRAAVDLLEEVGADVAGMAVLVELAALEGRQLLKDHNLLSILRL